MKPLLRLYPRSWRERYGDEMEALLEETSGEAGVALDLLLGAAVACAAVIRANRILSAAGAFVHGACVAVLLQAIAFVTLILVSEQSNGETDVQLGPFRFAAVMRLLFLGPLERDAVIFKRWTADAWLPTLALLAVLVASLALVVAAPRLVRRLQ